MTLFISYLLIYNFDMSGAWYFFAFVLWLIHLAYHSESN